MDGLGEEDAAAVAGEGAAAGFVVVALGAPPGDGHAGGGDGADCTGGEGLAEAQAAGAEAVLQHDAEAAVRGAAGGDEAGAAFDGEFEGFFEQDVFAGGEAAFGDLGVGGGRREDEDGGGGRVGDDGVEVGGGGDAEAVGEGLGARLGAAGGGAEFDAVGEVVEAFGVGFGAGAEADYGDRDAGHAGMPPERVTRSARDWAASARRQTVQTWDWFIAVAVRSRTSAQNWRK